MHAGQEHSKLVYIVLLLCIFLAHNITQLVLLLGHGIYLSHSLRYHMPSIMPTYEVMAGPRQHTKAIEFDPFY